MNDEEKYWMYSSDHATAGYRPRFVVDYAVPERSRAMPTLNEYVENRIRAIFTDLAAQIANGEIIISADEAAGVPYTLFMAEHDLLATWRRVTGGERC